MPTTETRVSEALKTLPAKPEDSATRALKKRYSELASSKIALALADDLRSRGLTEARPGAPGELSGSGAERRMAGGIGAKKVDVTWATEVSGLLLGISIKTINFRDSRTGNFQKNLTNRRGDMLMEAVTLHRRFPYAVLGGFFFLDAAAAEDGTNQRRSTFLNAHSRLRLFTGRDDPSGREEQFERLYLVLLSANAFLPVSKVFSVGEPDNEMSLSEAVEGLLKMVPERNPDFYDFQGGKLVKAST